MANDVLADLDTARADIEEALPRPPRAGVFRPFSAAGRGWTLGLLALICAALVLAGCFFKSEPFIPGVSSYRYALLSAAPADFSDPLKGIALCNQLESLCESDDARIRVKVDVTETRQVRVRFFLTHLPTDDDAAAAKVLRQKIEGRLRALGIAGDRVDIDGVPLHDSTYTPNPADGGTRTR